MDRMMPMTTAQEVLTKLAVDISDKQRVFDIVTRLQGIYPDLIVQYNDRITAIASLKLSSSAVNGVVNDVDIEKYYAHTNKEIVEAWPYTVVDGCKIYSNPPSYTIGEINELGFGVNPTSGWDDIMVEAGLPKAAIRAARHYLKKNPPIAYVLHSTIEP